MDNRTLYALAFAIIGMGCRMIVFMLGWDFAWSTQLYFLFLLLAIFFGIREYFKDNSESSFMQLFKYGAQIGAMFSLVVSIFTFVFYRFVDVLFFEDMKEERLQAVRTTEVTPEQIENYQSNLDMVFNANTQAMVTLICFVLLGLTYSAIVSGILSKVPFFARNFK